MTFSDVNVIEGLMALRNTNMEILEKLKADIELLQLKYPVAHIARMTGMDGGNVSAYLSGKKPLGEKFIDRFYKVFGGELKKISSPQMVERKDAISPQTECDLLKSIDNTLIEIVKVLNDIKAITSAFGSKGG